MKDSYFYLKL